MKFKRGVNLCKMESNGRATTVTTGDVPPGVAYNFVWNTSPDGLYKNSNCSYYGDELVSIGSGAESCGMYCASTPSCDLFSWWGGHCLMKSKSAKQLITLATNANWPSNCGQAACKCHSRTPSSITAFQAAAVPSSVDRFTISRSDPTDWRCTLKSVATPTTT